MVDLVGNFDLNSSSDYAEEDDFLFTNQEFRARENYAKEAISLYEAAMRLSENADFKKVVIELYLEKEPARLVGMLAASLPEGQHKAVQDDLMGIGKFKLFMSHLVQAGNTARQDLEDLRYSVDKYGTAKNQVNQSQ